MAEIDPERLAEAVNRIVFGDDGGPVIGNDVADARLIAAEYRRLTADTPQPCPHPDCGSFILNGEHFSAGYTVEAARYEQATRP